MQHQIQRLRRHRRSDQSGLTVLEIVISMVVLSVASLFSLSVTVSSVSLEKVNREENSATAIVRRITEELRAVPFNQLFASFNANPADDPGGAGSALGSNFVVFSDDQGNIVSADALSVAHVANLPTQHGAAPVARGRSNTRQDIRRIPVSVSLSFPVDGAANLDETAQLPLFGNQRFDLNADGQVSAGSRNTDYRMLPVIIRLQWTGSSGTRIFEVAQVISDL